MNDTSWGRWGNEDERGALNLLTPDVVLAATRSCRTGAVYRLGLPVQSTGIPLVPYRGTPQRLTLMNHADDTMQRMGAPEGMGANEDVLVMASHTGTHIDALCHVFADGRIYNGFPANSFSTHDGASRCGIEKNGGFAARAVLFDLPRAHGVDSLDPGHVVTADELEACVNRQSVELRPGDVALVRTGWIDQFLSRPGSAGFAQPGIGRDGARWLASHDVAAVGADNTAVEAIPFDGGEFLCVHVELIVRRGVPLIENLKLAEPAADGCHEGLLVVSPLLVPGATGSPVNPILIG